jgi:hypothetical protein
MVAEGRTKEKKLKVSLKFYGKQVFRSDMRFHSSEHMRSDFPNRTE